MIVGNKTCNVTVGEPKKCGKFKTVLISSSQWTSEANYSKSKVSTFKSPHHSATLNTETRPNSASTSGPSKTITSNTLFPGAFSHHTRRITAQAKDVTFALKKNSLSSANPSYQHLTNVMNSYHLAATETKPSYETTNPLNFALHILCKLYCI